MVPQHIYSKTTTTSRCWGQNCFIPKSVPLRGSVPAAGLGGGVGCWGVGVCFSMRSFLNAPLNSEHLRIHMWSEKKKCVDPALDPQKRFPAPILGPTIVRTHVPPGGPEGGGGGAEA